jgi:DNA-binding protein HU-beta
MPAPKLTAQILEAAILGMESQKEKLDAQIAELRQMLEGAPDAPATNPGVGPRKRKTFSAATRRRMKEAQRLRWAKIRGESEPPAPATSKPKRKLSKARKAALVANLAKARAARAAKRAEAAKAEQAASKKADTNKPATKKAAKKTAPAKATKKAAPVKKALTKKTAPAPAPATTETGAQ